MSLAFLFPFLYSRNNTKKKKNQNQIYLSPLDDDLTSLSNTLLSFLKIFHLTIRRSSDLYLYLSFPSSSFVHTLRLNTSDPPLSVHYNEPTTVLDFPPISSLVSG